MGKTKHEKNSLFIRQKVKIKHVEQQKIEQISLDEIPVQIESVPDTERDA